MPRLNHSGPEGKGSKTGRKLGNCHLTEADMQLKGEPGFGLAERRNSGGGSGKGRRINYNKERLIN